MQQKLGGERELELRLKYILVKKKKQIRTLFIFFPFQKSPLNVFFKFSCNHQNKIYFTHEIRQSEIDTNLI